MKGHFCWLWSQMHLPTLETSVLPVIQSEIPLQQVMKQVSLPHGWASLLSELEASCALYVVSLGVIICMPELFLSLLIAVPLEKRNIP